MDTTTFKHPPYLKRELYLSRIRPFIGRDLIKVLTGLRRSGKSVMLELIKDELVEHGIAPEQFIHINFDSALLPFPLTRQGAFDYIRAKVEAGAGQFHVFLDEIQDLPEWEKMVNSLMIDFDADIYITGSNAKLLSGELATHLTGRYIQVKILPFSYAEFLEVHKAENTRGNFELYLLRGGMPFLNVESISMERAREYLLDIYETIVSKDIVSRYEVRDIELLRRILLFFFSNIGNVFSAKSIIKFLKSEYRSSSNETLYNYIEYAKTAHLLYQVPREGLAGKKHLHFQEKIFVADTGLRNALLHRGLEDIGQLLENAVYLELLRRGYNVTVGKIGEQEIDFVASGAKGKFYIQVCYILYDKEVLRREFSPFEKIPDNEPKYVVSMDETNFSHNGYKHYNIRDFLLSDDF
ncbi:MAG: ATP-binding protein [Puniceicoccales bacterium]|jgi:predicted AAA+ superfamily ATPase|nr:ATP-binding protein [Puniceicoccales bacterium]